MHAHQIHHHDDQQFPFGPGFPGRGPGRHAPGGGRGGSRRSDRADRIEGAVRGRGGGRGRGRGRGWGDGFGPGFGPGEGFGPGFGGTMFGRGPKVGRGDVRAAILALLAEEPMHGYQVITELTERSGGVWRPSPGSV